MGLDWIQVDGRLRSHRKTLKLAAALRDPRAHTWLVDLWAWASLNEPSGLIPGPMAEDVVEGAVGWTGDQGALAAAMINSGWLDRGDSGSLLLHDWADHQGARIARVANAKGPRVPTVYFVRDGDSGPIKIGFTERLEHRLATLRTSNAGPIHLIGSAPGTRAEERYLHVRFGHLRIAREWFIPDPDLLAFIRNLPGGK